MRAIQYVRSVPRYLAVRSLGRWWEGAATSRLAPVRFTRIAEPPLPGPRWARVRPLLAGVCGSDLATVTASGSTYFAPFTSMPFVLGHEVVGEVVETGPEVARVRVGDRVVLFPPLHCEVRGIEQKCAPCRAGMVGHCTNVTRGMIAPGIQTGFCRDTGGGWGESLVAHDVQLFPLPASLSDRTAVLVEPLACCFHAVERAVVPDGATVLVLGVGSIGALTLVALRAIARPVRVVAVAKYPHQMRAAQELGADLVVNAGSGMREELARALGAELYHPEIGPPSVLGGADVAFDCVGSGRTIDDAMRFTRARGAVIVVGMPGIAEGIDWTAMWHKELTVRGSYTSHPAAFDRAIDLAAEMDGRLALFVGGVFGLEAWKDALGAALDTGRSGILKTAFRP
ncbi:MAG: zinc-binding dehydrogenase [Gemmatimonadota bacterium]